MLPYRFCFVLLFYLREISKYNPTGPYIRRGDLTEGFLLQVLGANFKNFSVIMKTGDSSPHISETNDRFSF